MKLITMAARARIYPRGGLQLLAVIAATALHFDAAHGIVFRDDVPLSEYEALATRPEYQCVVKLFYKVDGDSPFYHLQCSAVLISPNWVLTAAHCINGPLDRTNPFDNLLRSSYGSPVAIEFRGTIDGTNVTVLLGALEWFPFADHSRTTGLGNGFDIALVRLSPLAGGRGERLMTNYVPAILYQGTSEIGQLGTSVGYGAWGTGLEGGRNWTPVKKLAAQNMIDADGSSIPFLDLLQDRFGRRYFDPPIVTLQDRTYFAGLFGSVRELASDFDHPTNTAVSSFGSATPLPLEGITASGDSGGGLFIQIAGTNFLAGITSYGSGSSNIFPVPGGYGTMPGATRVSAFVEWINDHLSYSSFAGTNGMDVTYNTPALWDTGTLTNYQSRAVPEPQHTVVFNLPALAITNHFYDPPWPYYIEDYTDWPVPSSRTTCRLTLDGNRVNTRMRVRRGTDLTFDLNGFTYSLTSTSSHTASMVIGQGFSDNPVLTITNGTLVAYDAHIAEWGDAFNYAYSTYQYYLGTCGGAVNVRGTGTSWILNNDLHIGGRRNGPGGDGRLNVDNGARVDVAGLLKLWFVVDLLEPVHLLGYDGAYGYQQKFVGGTLNLNGGSATAGRLDIAGGGIEGTGDIQVTGETIWRAGHIATSGNLDARGGLRILGGEIRSGRSDGPIRPLLLSGGSISNHGFAAWTGTIDLQGENGSIFYNLRGATFDAQNEQNLSGTNATFNNSGLFRKSVGTNLSVVEWAFNNSNTVEAAAGTLRFQGWISQLENAALTDGRWVIGDAATLEMVAGGPILTNRASVEFNGRAARFPQFDSLRCNEGELALQNGKAFISTGHLANLGILRIGSECQLSVRGDFLQSTSAVVSITASSTNGAALSIDGMISLAGTFQVSLPADADPFPGQVIPLVTAGRVGGQFDNVIISTGPHVTAEVVYSSTGVTLKVLAVPQKLAITAISIQGSDIAISWFGSAPPYQLQWKTNLLESSWTPLGGFSMGTNASIPVTGSARFFRVVSRD